MRQGLFPSGCRIGLEPRFARNGRDSYNASGTKGLGFRGLKFRGSNVFTPVVLMHCTIIVFSTLSTVAVLAYVIVIVRVISVAVVKIMKVTENNSNWNWD